MGLAVTCPRCGDPLRQPGLTHSEWLCDKDGQVQPMHRVNRLGDEVLARLTERAGKHGVPVWCPWPLPAGWLMTGLGWVGDERQGVTATAVACTGPTPLGDGPADVVLVAEEPGVGLGARIAGLPGPDLGPDLAGLAVESEAHAKLKVAGRPTPLWSVEGPEDRSVYAGEAKGRWLYAIAWPAHAGYFFVDNPELRDLTEWLPAELFFGAMSRRL